MWLRSSVNRLTTLVSSSVAMTARNTSSLTHANEFRNAKIRNLTLRHTDWRSHRATNHLPNCRMPFGWHLEAVCEGS